MVSPWMKQGDLQQYIVTYPDIERYPLVRSIPEITYFNTFLSNVIIGL